MRNKYCGNILGNQLNEGAPVEGFAGDIFYLDDVSSGVGSYYSLPQAPVTTTPEVEDSASSSGGAEALIEAYITASGVPGVTHIPAGVWELHTWAKTSGGTTSYLRAKVYKRADDGTETLLFTVTSSALTASYGAEEVLVSTQPAIALLATDRLVLKMYAYVTGGASRTVSFTHNGTARYTHLALPLVMLHGVTCDDTTATDSEIAIFVGNDGREIRGSDVKMSATPTATTVVVSDASGKLAAGWGGAASSLATLNASAKVVELPADATATPSANSIPISTAQSKLDGWVSEATATTAGRSKILVATAIKTGNYTCTSSYSKVRVNPTGGAFWVKPIAEPADGDLWAIVNEYSSANTITATANTATVAQTIEGGASLALASPFFSVVFQYNLALLNWTIYAMS